VTVPGGRRVLHPLRGFLRTEAGAGVLLVAATAAALVWANSPWSESYDDFWHSTIAIGSGSWGVREDLQHWVNDALMVLFFFLIGLEIKRELVVGELRDRRAASLPVLAAIGGMAVPALVFIAVSGGGEAARGWAIPMATDIAFVVGILALLGRRIPSGLKVFLLTLAIVDDIGAIAVIALFYSSGLSPLWLLGAASTLGAVVLARRAGVSRPVSYLPLGLLAWYCTYRAGIHPTIAGVALGMMTPARPVGGRAVLEDLEHRLHPWSSYLVIPVFALANAGVALSTDVLREAAASRLTWAVALGLVVGKVVGISAISWAGVKTGAGRLPTGVVKSHILGGSALAGIGFTVSLFITGLAFTSTELQTQAKIGILAGSLVAGIVGAGILTGRNDGPLVAEGEAQRLAEPVGDGRH
jgi:Na+:H+ antiporter, NhaA family